ncbi:hypothetical protein [uncultured Azohydromonas sp.]|jgi:hypothetical protein|uniref:hypothetical protein n=1 Tax=uncultured Azohydromonas sp. TaxID=487342 RepID=UPI0026095C7C|nr:hypothetical protein [uncultured Azohydromonas sp.]
MDDKTVSVRVDLARGEASELEAFIAGVLERVPAASRLQSGLVRVHQALARELCATGGNAREVKPAQRLCQSCPDRTCAGPDNARFVMVTKKEGGAA